MEEDLQEGDGNTFLPEAALVAPSHSVWLMLRRTCLWLPYFCREDVAFSWLLRCARTVLLGAPEYGWAY